MNKEILAMIERLRAGDSSGFDMLYREYSEKLYKYILRFVKKHHDAEDILEETFLKVIENIGELKHTFAFEIWIYKTAKHTALHFLEKKDNSARVKPDCELDDLIDVPDGFISLPEDYTVRKDIADAVNAAVCSLSDEQRETVYLKYYENKTIAEIANIMHVSQGTVKTRLSLAKKHLARKLEWLSDSDSVFVLVPIGSLVGSAKRHVNIVARPAFALRLVGAAACAGVAVAGLSAYMQLNHAEINDYGYYQSDDSEADSSQADVGVYHEVNMRLKSKFDTTGICQFLSEPVEPSSWENQFIVIEGTTFQAKGYIIDENGDRWYNVIHLTSFVQGRDSDGWVKAEFLEPAGPDELFPYIAPEDWVRDLDELR